MKIQYLIPDHRSSFIVERPRQSVSCLQIGWWAQSWVNVGWDMNIHFFTQQTKCLNHSEYESLPSRSFWSRTILIGPIPKANSLDKARQMYIRPENKNKNKNWSSGLCDISQDNWGFSHRKSHQSLQSSSQGFLSGYQENDHALKEKSIRGNPRRYLCRDEEVCSKRTEFGWWWQLNGNGPWNGHPSRPGAGEVLAWKSNL